jgi:hypothetical protein
MSEEPASRLLEAWYNVDDQNLSLRTAILKPKALEAIHRMNRLTHKLLLLISLPESVRKEYLTKEWSKAEQIIQQLKSKAMKENDATLLREANALAVKLELAKRYNTLPNFIDKLMILNNMLNRLINATSAVEGRTFYGVLSIQQQRKRRFFFKEKEEEVE